MEDEEAYFRNEEVKSHAIGNLNSKDLDNASSEF